MKMWQSYRLYCHMGTECQSDYLYCLLVNLKRLKTFFICFTYVHFQYIKSSLFQVDLLRSSDLLLLSKTTVLDKISHDFKMAKQSKWNTWWSCWNKEMCNHVCCMSLPIAFTSFCDLNTTLFWNKVEIELCHQLMSRWSDPKLQTA